MLYFDKTAFKSRSLHPRPPEHCPFLVVGHFDCRSVPPEEEFWLPGQCPARYLNRHSRQINNCAFIRHAFLGSKEASYRQPSSIFPESLPKLHHAEDSRKARPPDRAHCYDGSQ